MTSMPGGFIIESLALVGPSKPAADLTFSDGLNVVTGASDTGKSYALACIDYAFGGGKISRVIPQAEGYHAVVVRLRARQSRHTFELTRSLAGGDATLREVDASGAVVHEGLLGSRHDPTSVATISGLLLALSGLAAKRVRTNKKGELRGLSFRDVAFLILVDEERIISERPPHLSGSPIERTVEGSVLRLLATGAEVGDIASVPEKKRGEALRAQLELVQQLEAQATAEIEQLGSPELDVAVELARIDVARNETLAAYEGSRVELLEVETRISQAMRELRQSDGRLLVLEGLDRRFTLLRDHYDSDRLRLEAVEEAGSLLEAFPSRSCPLCGAGPDAQRATEAEAYFQLDDIRVAARAEAAKVATLQSDLSKVMEELTTERVALQSSRQEVRSEVKALQEMVNRDLQPKLSASAAALRSQADLRDRLLRAQTFIDQRAALRQRAAGLQAKAPRMPKVAIDTTPTTSELEGFALSVQELLRQWNVPDAERVVFAEADQDLVIGGQPRASHGKGVRALTCAAFIAGLMRSCAERALPHPGVILLDSPLVVYREPDAAPDEQRLRQAGVKEAFYRSLAAGAAGGQVIVFENEDPPTIDGITLHHFSRSASGRYGFIPVTG